MNDITIQLHSSVLKHFEKSINKKKNIYPIYLTLIYSLCVVHEKIV